MARGHRAVVSEPEARRAGRRRRPGRGDVANVIELGVQRRGDDDDARVLESTKSTPGWAMIRHSTVMSRAPRAISISSTHTSEPPVASIGSQSTTWAPSGCPAARRGRPWAAASPRCVEARPGNPVVRQYSWTAAHPETRAKDRHDHVLGLDAHRGSPFTTGVSTVVAVTGCRETPRRLRTWRSPRPVAGNRRWTSARLSAGDLVRDDRVIDNEWRAHVVTLGRSFYARERPAVDRRTTRFRPHN